MSGNDIPPVQTPGSAPAFVPGDLLIAVNDVAQPVDFRAGVSGRGRYWHCDAFFRKKRAFHIGENGLIIGLAWDAASQTVIASMPRLSKLVAVDAQGRARALRFPPARPYGALAWHASGDLIAGIHVNNAEPEGKLVRFNPFTGDQEAFDVAIDGGRGGRHGITGLATRADAPDIIRYVSEAGRRICQYDIGKRRQLPDWHVMADGDARTYGLAIRDCGEVLMATGNGAIRFSPEGQVMQRYAVPTPRGWTRAALSADGRHFYLGNFMEGLLQRRDIETGETVAEHDVGLRGALTALVEIPAIS